MPRTRATKRASNRPRVSALLLVLLAALLAAALGACGTVLNIAPDEPSDGGGTGEGSTTVDGSGSFVDFEAGDASTACGLSVDTKTIALGEIITGTAPITRQIHITSFVDSPTTVTLTVAGGGFTSLTASPLVVPANAPTVPFDVTFAAGASGAQVGVATLTWAGCAITIPLSANTIASGGVAVSPAILDLGSVACGLMPPSGAIHVATSATLNWTSSITPGPFASQGSGTFNAGTNDITVSSGPVLPAEDPRQVDADFVLSISGQSPRTVHLTTRSLGGKLRFEPNDVTLTKTQPSRTIALVNDGTQAVRVNLAIDPPFTISASGSSKVTVLPGGIAAAQPVTVSTVTASSGPAVQSAKVTLNTGTLCFAGPLTVRQ